jgi:hypothetical protein
MWSRGVILLLTATTVNALASTLTLETALMLLMENLRLPHDTATMLIGIVGFTVTLFSIGAARAVDRLPTLWLPFGASLGAVALRIVMALVIALGLDSSVTVVAVALCFMAVMALDGVLVAQPLTIYLNGQIARQTLVSGSDDDGGSARIFGLRYSLTNLAALVGTLGYDVLRTYAPTVNEANILAQLLGLVASIVTVGIIGLAVALTPAAPLKPFSATPAPLRPKSDSSSNACRHFLSFVGDRTLWRFSAFCLLLLGTSSIFRHIDQTLAPVMQRLFDSKVHFALIQAINPALVIVLAPLMQWLTEKRSGYWVIVTGTFLSGLSLVPLVIAGGAPRHASARVVDYVPYAVFMALFSLGESLWSARFTKYTLDAAPPEDKAFYFAVSSIPQLLARLVAAWHSAWLVSHYCPSSDACAPRYLWLTVWLISLITPVALTLFNRWIDPRQTQLLTDAS